MAVFWMLVNPGPPLRRNMGVFLVAVLVPLLLFLPLAAAATRQATTTTLVVSPTLASTGQVVTLTATVLCSGNPVETGMVTFANGTGKVLGTVQVVGNNPAPGFLSGTASLKMRFPPGIYSITATFNGTNSYLGSSSTPQPLTVTGTEPSITTLTDQPDGNNFDFTTSVFGFGFPVPTGMVQFADLTDGFNLGAVALAGPATSTFLPQRSFPTGLVPLVVASGDFNGDGLPDLVVVNGSDNTLSVLLGNGDGTFQPQIVYNTGSELEGVAVGDFNGDGFLDLAVTNKTDDSVDVLLGNGDGTFQALQMYGAGHAPTGIAAADFNGDGIADLAVTDIVGNTVSVLLGSGDGIFELQGSYDVGQAPYGVAVADFNGDGLADLAVTNQKLLTISVLLGNGDGSFQPQQTYGVGQFPTGIAVGDFNADGIADLAVTNLQDNTVSVLLGKGNGTFQPQQTYGVGQYPDGVAVADFNGDGIPDLAVANGAGTVGVLLGKGTGTFQPQQTYGVGQDPIGIAVADFNGDGVPDVANANSADNTVSILLGGTAITAQLNNVPIIGAGNHTIQSSYVPDSSSLYAASMSNSVIVPAGGKATPNVNLQATPTEINLGNSVLFVATTKSPGGGAPTGTVTFVDGTTPLGTASLDANGVANYTNTTLVLGQHSVTATYNGDNNFNSATSAAVIVQVDNPFILQSTKYSDTVSPGDGTQFQTNVIAAYQNSPLVYAVMSCTAPAGTGITCSVACPPGPPGLPAACILTSSTEVATVTVNTPSGIARAVRPLHRDDGPTFLAALTGLGGVWFVGLILIPRELRREAIGGILFLVIVMLCFGTSCTGNFAPGISSPPVNNTFYISVNAELREEIGDDPTQFRTLGLQKFWFTLLIK